jgi:hypothetical protein
MKKLLFLLSFFLTGCVTQQKILKNPQEWYYLPAIVMDWNEEYPVEIWRATIKLEEPFTGIDSAEYILYKLDDPYQDSLYILQIKPF